MAYTTVYLGDQRCIVADTFAELPTSDDIVIGTPAKVGKNDYTLGQDRTWVQNTFGGAVGVANDWSNQSWPEDRHDEQGGTGTNAADVHFSTTDSTNFNEHILEVTAGAVDLTVAITAGSTHRNIFVESLTVADQLGAQITGVGLPVGIYRFKGNFTEIKVVQNGAVASASDLVSYCK